MWKGTDSQEVGLEAAILQRKRNSSLVESVRAEDSTGLSGVPKPGVQKTEYRRQGTEPRTEDRRQKTVQAGTRGVIRDVTDLAVYRKAYAVSLDIHRMSVTLPRHEQYELAAQARRASKSVCANLAEGFGKQSTSKPEFKRYIQMAIGSADEMRLWLQYLADLGYADPDQVKQWQATYRDIARMLTGLHHKWS